MMPYWGAATIAALVSIFYAKVFAWCEQMGLSIFEAHHWLVFISIPVAIIGSTLLAELFSPTAAGSGIPQLIAAVEMSRHPNTFLDRMLGIRMMIAKFIGSCLCVLGGAVTGREGPNLQISAAIFNQVHRYWPKAKASTNLQPMILAGGAAGLAAAFNTPLGGIVFAIEELAKVHISHVRTAIFHAVIIAGLLVQAILGNYLYLGTTTLTVSGAAEIFLLSLGSIAIGAIGGLFGVVIVRALSWRSSLIFRNRMAVTAACGFAMATLVFFSGRVAMGSGREVIVNLLSHPEHMADWSTGFVRVAANFLTYSGGVIGGVFAPALSSGAGFGSFFGSLAGSANPELWVLVGMVAFLTGLTRTPFTSMILVLEMTRSSDVIVVLMLAAIIAQGAAKLIDPISFYEHASMRLIKMAERT
ncbi:MAG TPA: chloride channel protein [Bdellovibrionales bacterium]|nr:chloride channel protein [Bdellovibrionales bacterium]